MKELARLESPEILDQYTAGQNDWMEIDQSAVWPKLTEMQGEFCAYCECRLNRRHIEHFRPRGKFPALTFIWSNLFGSCGDSKKCGGWSRCGIYKDNGAGAYNADDLIKPDEENPDDYLLFLTTGEVVPAIGLTGRALKKAQETIRVFHLNGDIKLLGSRRTAVQAIMPNVEYLYSLLEEFEVDDWNEMLRDELEKIESDEFKTALKHAWTSNQEFA